MYHHAKFRQNRPNDFWDITIFLIFKMAAFRHLGFWNFGWRNIHRRTKFRQNLSNDCWDIAFNNLKNGGRPPYWIFKSLIFDQLVSSARLICAFIQNFVKIGQTVYEITIFQFSRWPPSAILDFEILKFLISRQVGRAKMHHRTKVHRNRSNGCRDIAFNVFQNGGLPPCWIFRSLIFWSAG